jgi:membrane dipeptidase
MPVNDFSCLFDRAAGLLVALFLIAAVSGCGGPGTPGEDSPSKTTEQEISPAETKVPGAVDGGDVRMPPERRQALIDEDPLWEDALRIHYNAIVFDGHIDTPMLMMGRGYDFTRRHRAGQSHVDLPRMFEAGLDAAFFAAYVPAAYGEGERAANYARELLDRITGQVASTDSAEIATTASDVRRITREGRKAILLSIEGGHAIGGSLEVLREMYDRGVRYMTLTHVNTNSWADASQSLPRWSGLNDLGREIVREMNRLGMLVDLSHTSDETFYDAIEVSAAPVILSHSSARAVTENVRNVDDAMLRALAANGGVIMINFHAPVVHRHLDAEVMAEVYRRIEARGLSLRQQWPVIEEVQQERGLGPSRWEHIIDHIDHAVRVAGIDHVGLGSDFDGAWMPRGMEEVNRLPWITYALLQRGYSEEDLYKILGGNTLRVMEAAERVARNLVVRSH